MSRTKSSKRKETPKAAGAPGTVETRIDQAHHLGGEESRASENFPVEMESEDALESPGEPSFEELPPDTAEEQLRRHAEQLAEYLRSRQMELDHRESQLNAQAAQLEADARTARIWLGERESELQTRLEQQNHFEMQWRERLDRLASAEAALTRREAEETARRSLEIQAEVRRLQDKWSQERQAQQEELRAERLRLAAEQRQAMAAIEKRRESLEERAESVNQSHLALGQVRAELQRLHGETLEVRLATEELWAQISGAAPPAAITRSLGRIRTQLAEHYRLANAELLEQKKELESIRGQLGGQFAKFVEKKERFERWSAERRQEVDEQAARLIAREEELEALESRFDEESRRWELKQQEYELEIRRLKLQMGVREGTTKVA